MTNESRSRLALCAWILVVIGLGLASRRFPSLLPAALGKYPGDALWALMVFFAWAAVSPTASTRVLVPLALATSFLVEVAQLYHAPWIDAIRSTTAGHLVLGSTFSWLDMAAYTVGVAIGAAFDVAWIDARARTE